MRIETVAAFVVVTLCAWVSCFAADPHATPQAPASPAHAAPAHATTAESAHPPAVRQAVLPPAGIRWPAAMILVVLGLFLAAAIIGPIARYHMPPEEIPVSTSHDGSHGHDHGHGHNHGPNHGHGGHS